MDGGAIVATGEGAQCVWATNAGAVLNISGGTFTATSNAIYVEAGTANITGGTFESPLNCKDGTFGTTSFMNVSGGRYLNFNPADNDAEGAHTNYVLAGYEATQDGDYYVVTKAE